MGKWVLLLPLPAALAVSGHDSTDVEKVPKGEGNLVFLPPFAFDRSPRILLRPINGSSRAAPVMKVGGRKLGYSKGEEIGPAKYVAFLNQRCCFNAHLFLAQFWVQK